MKHLKGLALGIFFSFGLITLSSCSFFSSIGERFGGSTKTEDTSNIPSSTVSNQKTTTNDRSSITPTISSTNTTKSTNTSGTVSPIVDLPLNYGYSDLENYENSSNLKLFYNDVNNSLNNFSKSSTNLTPTVYNVNGEDGIYYVIDELIYSSYNISSSLAQVVLKEVLLDHPEYYFTSSMVLTYTQTSGSNVTEKIILLADEDYKSSEDRLLYNTKIKEFKDDCIKDFTSLTSTKDKIKHVHDYILDKATYALDDLGNPSQTTFAHNLLGIVVEGKGVCESYTELFTYLLKSIDIPAITVTGRGYTFENIPSGEAHAWNYVNVDGYYYGFDVTWDDSTNSNDYYGLSYDNITKSDGENVTDGSHLATASNESDGIRYLYSLPELSSIDLKDRI